MTLKHFDGHSIHALGALYDVVANNSSAGEDVIASLNVEGDKIPFPGRTGMSSPPEASSGPTGSTPRAAGKVCSTRWSLAGRGLPETIGAAFGEMLSDANTSFALCPLLTDGAIEALVAAGSHKLKTVYLEKLVIGQWAGTMN